MYPRLAEGTWPETKRTKWRINKNGLGTKSCLDSLGFSWQMNDNFSSLRIIQARKQTKIGFILSWFYPFFSYPLLLHYISTAVLKERRSVSLSYCTLTLIPEKPQGEWIIKYFIKVILCWWNKLQHSRKMCLQVTE